MFSILLRTLQDIWTLTVHLISGCMVQLISGGLWCGQVWQPLPLWLPLLQSVCHTIYFFSTLTCYLFSFMQHHAMLNERSMVHMPVDWCNYQNPKFERNWHYNAIFTYRKDKKKTSTTLFHWSQQTETRSITRTIHFCFVYTEEISTQEGKL